MQRKWLDITRDQFYHQPSSSFVLGTSLRVNQVGQRGDELGRCCSLQGLALLLDDFLCVVPDGCFEALLLLEAGDGGTGTSVRASLSSLSIIEDASGVALWRRFQFETGTPRRADLWTPKYLTEITRDFGNRMISCFKDPASEDEVCPIRQVRYILEVSLSEIQRESRVS
jgi:hypothetical protein